MAGQPIFKFFGCQMTRTRVNTNIKMASMSVVDKIRPP